MVNGPPPAAAESSKSSEPGSTSSYNPYSATIAASQAQQGGYQTTGVSSNPWPGGVTSAAAAGTTAQPGAAYNYGTWPAMNWPGYPTTAAASHGAGSSAASHYNQHLHYQSYYAQAAQSQGLQPPSYPPAPQSAGTIPKQEEKDVKIPAKRKRRSPSPVPEQEPAPKLESYRHWDGELNKFLEEAGLHETLKGFGRDMLVLSSDWEQERIPKALQNLVKRLSGVVEISKPELGQGNMDVDEEPRIPLEERKLTYTKLAEGEVPRTPTSINKSISQLLAKNRAKINASNRSEFLYSMSERRRRIEEASSTTTSETTHPIEGTVPTTVDPSLLGSCARTDAKPINRDEQMGYDIAKNVKGPLSRTMKAAEAEQPEMSPEDEERVTPARYPALDERLKNVEAHFAVRYIPSPPRTLISRLKMLEDHIIKLEKEYPPWAALHFNQPNRGWPPPPRPTPIIVPVSMRSKDDPVPVITPDSQDTLSSSKSVSFATEPSESAPGSPSMSSAKPAQKARNSKSSLHRAVMEKLQVQQALNEMGGAD